MKNILKCTMIIVGTLIGAGFASGQEIATFFNRFLDNGMYGLILSSIFFGLTIFVIMMLMNKYDMEKYEQLINNNKFVLMIMKVFTFICFCIMISAIGSYGEQQYNVSFWYGAIFAGALCFVSFLFKFKGLEKINNVLVPLILIGTVMLGTANYDVNAIEFQTNEYTESVFINNWFLSAILYAAYNSILLIPILVELKVYKTKRKDIFLISCLTTLLLAVAGLLIYGAMNVYYPDILSVELPTLVLAESCGKFAQYYYGVVILFAIFTTAFSCGFSFLRMNDDKNYFRNTCLMCAFGIVLSRIGFSDMINFFFPIFGYLGIIQILIIALSKRKVSK